MSLSPYEPMDLDGLRVAAVEDALRGEEWATIALRLINRIEELEMETSF